MVWGVFEYIIKKKREKLKRYIMPGSNLFHLSLDFPKCILNIPKCIFKLTKRRDFCCYGFKQAKIQYTNLSMSGKIKFLVNKRGIFKPHPELSPLSDL